MDIKSILNQFKILDKNKDGTIQASEVESYSFKNTFLTKFFPIKLGAQLTSVQMLSVYKALPGTRPACFRLCTKPRRMLK
mgnify:FL=1